MELVFMYFEVALKLDINLIYCRPKPIIYVIRIMYCIELENYVYLKIFVLCLF